MTGDAGKQVTKIQGAQSAPLLVLLRVPPIQRFHGWLRVLIEPALKGDNIQLLSETSEAEQRASKTSAHLAFALSDCQNPHGFVGCVHSSFLRTQNYFGLLQTAT